MSQAPFSKPDVNDVASSSRVFKIRPSLNHWLRGRLPESRGKHLFGLVVIALLLLCLQLTACGNAPQPLGSASPTSNANSQPNTPPTTSGPGSTSATNPTTGPTNNPTVGTTTGPTKKPTVVPAADPKSFTVTNNGATYGFIGIAGQQATIDPNNDLTGDSVIHFEYGDPNSPTPAGPLNWSVSATQNWIGLDPTGGILKFGQKNQVNISVTIPKGMAVGPHSGSITFNPNTSASNPVILTVVSPGPTPTPTPTPTTSTANILTTRGKIAYTFT